MAEELLKETSQIQKPQEQEQSVDIVASQTQEVRDILESNPVLKGNLNRITNLRDFLQKLEANKHLFDKTKTGGDNSSAQDQFLKDAIEGFKYGEVTSDGRDFASLSEKDVDALSDNEYNKYEKWKGRMKAGVSANIDTDIVINTSGLEIEKTQKYKDKEIQAGLEKKLEALRGFVDTAYESLGEEGKTLIKKEESKLKGNTQALKALGIPEGEQDNPKYDGLIRASVLRGVAQNPDFTTRYVDKTKQREFQDSIQKIGELGIVAYPVELQKIDTHIDARFPRSESTDRAKEEIKRSIASGETASVYYDGKGEKYTLLDKDGKTNKEISMNPPITRISQENLSISRETPKREKTAGEKEQGTIEAQIQTQVQEMRESPYVGALASVDRSVFMDGFDKGVSSPDPKEKLRYTYDSLGKKANTLEKMIQEKEKGGEQAEAESLKSSLARVKEQIRGVEQLAKNYQGALERVIAEKGDQSPDTFDQTAKSNLSWLVENKWNRLGPNANEALSRVVEEINRTRDDRNKIRLDARTLDETEMNTLRKALIQIGGTPDVLTNGEKLPVLQKRITESLRYPRDNPQSIERVLSEGTNENAT